MKKGRVIACCLLLTVSAPASAKPAALYSQETGQSRGTGRIVGKARAEGRFKEPAPLKVYKNRDFCGSTVPNETLLVNQDGGLQNVVVIIHGTEGIRTPSRPQSPVLDNKNCAFVPHVQVVPVGSEIVLLNSDPILHNAHARLGSETLFNEGLPRWRRVTKRLARAGIIVVTCDVLHTWMSAYIVVTSSPHFAVTDRKGEFIIEHAPAGRYDLEFWHEKLGKQRRKIFVEEAQTSGIEVTFPCASC